MKNPFLLDFQARGLLNQVSSPAQDGWPTLDERLSQGPITAYIGFDPTAASLHVGSLLQIMNLARLQRAGHTPIAIVGGGTGLIGDPSGKASERSMLSMEQLAANVHGLRAQLGRYLNFSGANAAQLINNAEWLCELRLLDFLRDIGKLFSINQMVVRDSVKQRLEAREQGISYTEFSYALLQAYDFVVLNERLGCDLQMGASDQWGNITDGIDLIRRLRRKPAYGLTSPLVTKPDGSKFGKSESGNVWLDPELTRPFDFHQFWLNQGDAEALKYLRFFTFVEIEEIDLIAQQSAAEPQKRIAQKRLADEVTGFVHGQEALRSALRAGAVLFDGGDLKALTAHELSDAFAQAPRSALPKTALGGTDAGLVNVVAASGLEPSRGRARSAVESGAISINGELCTDTARVLTSADILAGDFIVLRRGKKSYHVLALA